MIEFAARKNAGRAFFYSFPRSARVPDRGSYPPLGRQQSKFSFGGCCRSSNPEYASSGAKDGRLVPEVPEVHPPSARPVGGDAGPTTPTGKEECQQSLLLHFGLATISRIPASAAISPCTPEDRPAGFLISCPDGPALFAIISMIEKAPMVTAVEPAAENIVDFNEQPHKCEAKGCDDRALMKGTRLSFCAAEETWCHMATCAASTPRNCTTTWRSCFASATSN
jgi:hypothetical protein